MVLFAFLGNTLFLTILVSMLTNTFSGIVGNAVQEIQFRRAVLTFEGVKSDAIFAYMPPFNILALVIMLPLKMVLSERMFHKINVAAVRTLNMPTLLIVALYERRTLWVSDRKSRSKRIDWKAPSGPRPTNAQYWALSRFSVHGDIHAVFDIDPPQSVLDKIAEEDDSENGEGIGRTLNNNLNDGFIQRGLLRSSTSRKGSAAAADNSEPQPKLAPDSEEEAREGRRSSQVVTAKKDKKRRRKPESSNKKGDRVGSPKPPQMPFADSSEAEDEDDHPSGYRKPRRGERMDSIVDMGNDDGDDDGGSNRLLEANARLHKMELAMARMEAMIAQLLDGDASTENSRAEEELQDEVRNQTMT
jgi:hypothetical protein